jgi:hypothetical protein
MGTGLSRDPIPESGTHFHIQRLNNGTALAGPVVLQLQDQALKGFDIEFLHNFFSREVKIRARFAECEPREYTVWHGRIIGEIAGDSRDGALL